MKRLIVFTSLFLSVIVFPGESHSTTVDVISQSYSISGYQWTNFPPDYSYNLSGSTPVSYGSAFATGSVGAASVYLGTNIPFGDSGTSSATIQFQVNEDFNADILYQDRTPFEHWSITLDDITTGSQIFSAGPWDSLQGSSSVTIESGHVYSLLDWSNSSNNDGLGQYAYVNMNFLTAVSEPSTMLLFGTGLAGIGLLRKRFKL